MQDKYGREITIGAGICYGGRAGSHGYLMTAVVTGFTPAGLRVDAVDCGEWPAVGDLPEQRVNHWMKSNVKNLGTCCLTGQTREQLQGELSIISGEKFRTELNRRMDILREEWRKEREAKANINNGWFSRSRTGA